MAYRRRKSSYSSRGRSRYTRRRSTARRRRSGGGTQRIVIQVIGGPAGGVPISATMGKKGARPLRARY